MTIPRSLYEPVATFGGAGVPPHCMGLTIEGRGHTPSVDDAPFKSAGMIMVVRVCVDIARGLYLGVLRPSVKDTLFHRGGDDRVCIL